MRIIFFLHFLHNNVVALKLEEKKECYFFFELFSIWESVLEAFTLICNDLNDLQYVLKRTTVGTWLFPVSLKMTSAF